MNGGENREQVQHVLAQLRRRQLWLEVALAGVSLLLIAASATAWSSMRRLAHPETLTLRRLDIVDGTGTPRVILAAPVPPPMRFGKPAKRDGAASGVVILDGTGTERGGYVTGDSNEPNALLTLDAQGKQTVLLLAEPGGSTGSLVRGAGDAGPFLNVRKGDEIFLSAPQGNPQSKDARPLFR